MDFDEAVATHGKWKRKLRRYLAKRDGTMNPAQVGVDHECELGQWIYGEGSSYSALPEFAKLKDEHARFHTAASEIVRKANLGGSVAEEIAPCSSSEFSKASSGLVLSIMSMKKLIGNASLTP